MQESEDQKNKRDFENIYQQQSDSVFRFCYFRVSDREVAMDITQEAFVKFWQVMDVEVVKNLKALLFTIAQRLVVDWYRKKKSVSYDALQSEDDEPFDVGDDLSRNEKEMESEARFAVEKIDMLGDSYRDFIYLRFVEGLMPKEIAEIMKLSVNATSVRINRGVEELRKLTGFNLED